MTYEQLLARESKGWYIWAAATAVVIVADMVLKGVTSLNIVPALLSIAFAYFMFRGKRWEDVVIARYQERPPSVGRTTTTTITTRVATLGLLEKGLWALWLVLVASCLAFPLAGEVNLSRAVTEGMTALFLASIPLRIWFAAALFR